MLMKEKASQGHDCSSLDAKLEVTFCWFLFVRSSVPLRWIMRSIPFLSIAHLEEHRAVNSSRRFLIRVREFMLAKEQYVIVVVDKY